VLHRDSTIGGSGTGGSYGGNAVVPEPFDGHEDLSRGDVLVSGNTGTVECGDGFCNGDETSGSCPGDCPACAAIPPEGRVVDEGELVCASLGGNPDYWRTEEAGWNDLLHWTHATDAGEPDNHAIWRLDFEEPGTYRFEVHTVAPWAQSRQAPYTVRHAGSEETFVVDQTATDGWSPVAALYFDAGGDQWVRLDDNTGEPFEERTQIVFDAIRVVRTGAPGEDAGVAPDAGGADGGTGPIGDGGASGDGGTRRPPADTTGGCSCGAAGRTAPGGGWALGALLLFIVVIRAAACRASSRRRESRCS